MYVNHVDSIAAIAVKAPGALHALKQVLVGPGEGWQGWVMRRFTLKRDGCSPRHSHPWPHINYIVSGRGKLDGAGSGQPLTAGSVAYVPENEEHQFINTGSEDLVFICIVPEQGDV